MFPIRTIKLASGGTTFVDACDWERLLKFSWSKNGSGHVYRQGLTNGKHWNVFMHRVVNKTPKGCFTDHINGNKLDNRRCNLRNATKAQNSTNQPKRNMKTISVFKGVCIHRLSGLWRARVNDGGYEKTTYHKTQRLAALDYNRMAVERFGKYAWLNAVI